MLQSPTITLHTRSLQHVTIAQHQAARKVIKTRYNRPPSRCTQGHYNTLQSPSIKLHARSLKHVTIARHHAARKVITTCYNRPPSRSTQGHYNTLQSPTITQHARSLQHVTIAHHAARILQVSVPLSASQLVSDTNGFFICGLH